MSDYQDKLGALLFNPGLMAGVALDELESQLAGTGSYDIPTPGMPFVWALENATLQCSSAVAEGESVLRRYYPTMGLTTDDLYLHMSDTAYIDRFSSPATIYFEHFLLKDEILAKLVSVDDTGIKQLTIPRYTSISVNGIVSTFQYPILIRQLSHGGFQISYDLTTTSPIQTLDSNIVESKEIQLDGKTYIWLRTPVKQVKLNISTDTLNPSNSFGASYDFTDLFYYARVYIRKSGAVGWTEIKTTHTDQVFDPTVLTATLKVVGNQLEVALPPIYTTTGKAEGQIRVDIYTTKGAIDVDLGSYTTADYTVNFEDIDDDTTYTAPIRTLQVYSVMSPDRVTGGSDGMSFEDLRNAVINNTVGPDTLPITNAQIQSALSRRGYDIVSNVDNLTKRQFFATKRLPAPTIGSAISSAGTIMATVQLNMSQIAASKHVSDNGERITILPSMLYRYNSGLVNLVSDTEVDQILAMGIDARAKVITDNRFLYSPFHYVLDATQSNFDVRPYYLDSSKITQKSFVGVNDSSQLQANINTYAISRTDKGWRITVQLTSSDAFKQIRSDLVYMQLGYVPVGETQYASVNGTNIGTTDSGEYIFQFDIETNYDIDSDGGLFTTNLSMYDATQTGFSLNLLHDLDFSIVVAESITPDYAPNWLDSLLQSYLLPQPFMVVTRERLTVRFGYDMTELWHRSRTVLSSESYQTYADNVPDYYTETVYLTDAAGNTIITVDSQGALQYTVLHNAGDPKLDSNGAPIYKHLAGDPVVDGNGGLILKDPRQIERNFTIFMVDGIYYFATEAKTVEYRTSIPLQLVSWIQGDIDTLRSELLELCELYLYPTTTYGDYSATVDQQIATTVNVDQTIVVNYYMTNTALRNSSLRAQLTQATKATVYGLLNSNTVTRSSLINALKLLGGDDVVEVDVGGLGGDANYRILTLDDSSVRLSVGKRPVILSDATLAVEDDITINFLKHWAD